MSDQEDVKAALSQWLDSLDNGNLEGMLETCDPEVILANEKTPTTVGIQHVKKKYAPRIDAANFKSGFDIEHITIHDNFAIIVGHFDVEMTNKQSGEINTGSGRLALVYRRHLDGSWKMILDIDNNA